MTTSAVLSDDGAYRYYLSRVWEDSAEKLVFVMLNPSTADAEADDPTIRKCIGFARRFGFGGIEVVNLFAYRATKPEALRDPDADPVGPDNDHYLRNVCRNRFVVCAWGALGRVYYARVQEVLRLLEDVSAVAVSLALTKHGHPQHPLMLAYDAAKLSLMPKAV